MPIFVDGRLIAAESYKIVKNLINHLSCAYKNTIGDSSVFVGMQIELDRARKSLFLHQIAYTKRVISKFRMSDVKPLSAPSYPHQVLYSVVKGEIKSESVPLRKAVKSIMFLVFVFHKCKKHIDIRYNYIRKKADARELEIIYVPS